MKQENLMRVIEEAAYFYLTGCHLFNYRVEKINENASLIIIFKSTSQEYRIVFGTNERRDDIFYYVLKIRELIDKTRRSLRSR